MAFAQDKARAELDPDDNDPTIPAPLVASFEYYPETPWVNETVTFNATQSHSPNGNITTYEWDSGDENITTVTVPAINHTCTEEGYYNVTLEVTGENKLRNSTLKTITITFRTDVNRDKIVNIMDIAIVARAYGSHGPDIPNPGDRPSKNWNETADLDKNGWINIMDIATVARDYEKTT